MPAFEIRCGGFRRDASLRAGFYYFDVHSSETEARFGLEFPDSLGRQWGLEGRANADEVQCRAVLGCFKRHLAAIDAPTRDPARLVLLTASEPPKFGGEWAVYQVPKDCPYERKECKHQHTRGGERLCGAAREGDRIGGRTTLALCEACGLPSTDILCDNLVNVETAGFGTDQTPLRKRSLIEAQCDIGSEQFVEAARDVKLCVPGGLNCWLQTYEPGAGAPTIVPAAAQFSIAEAIDQVNAAFRSRYDRKLIVIEHARAIEDLAGDCGTDDSLQHKLQVLAGLLQGMQLSGLLTEEQAEGCQGSIDLLARLSGRDFPTLAEQHVRILRNINKLAAGYPRHAKVKNIERAHTELGLPYPVTDYGGAWTVVKERFTHTLLELAAHLR
jgi:hypothetical protein